MGERNKQRLKNAGRMTKDFLEGIPLGLYKEIRFLHLGIGDLLYEKFGLEKYAGITEEVEEKMEGERVERNRDLDDDKKK